MGKRPLSEKEADRLFDYSIEPWVWKPRNLPEGCNPEAIWEEISEEATRWGMAHLKALEEHVLRMLKAVVSGYANKMKYYAPDIDERLLALPTAQGEAVLNLKLNVIRAMMDQWAYHGHISEWEDISQQISPQEPRTRFEEYLVAGVKLLREGYEIDTLKAFWQRIAEETPTEQGRVVKWESVLDSLKNGGAFLPNSSNREVKDNLLEAATRLRLF